MKLQNLAVIFVIIAIPIILVLAYYMSLQSDTLKLQAAYNTKLLDSTKEAIDAFEINTVEWNANYSETADSKRRDVMASINTFTNAFANNTGVSGISKEYILAHMPAIAFTLYDGYYIYSPAEIKVTSKNSNEVTKFNEDNQILYLKEDGTETTNPEEAATEYKHILKPFTSYSEKIVSTVDGGNTEVIINYTLDNYVTLYGEMKDTDGEVRYVSRGGYLTDTAKINGIDSGTIENIKFDGKDIEPEILTEKIAYKDGDTTTTGTFNYVYEAEGNTKVYIEGNTAPYRFFRINTNLERVDVESLSEPLYKKCTIPKENGGNKTYIELYQKLTSADNKWYTNKNGEYIEATNTYGVETYDVKQDFSAINYYVESYIFTKWFNGLNLEVSNNAGTPEDTSDDYGDKNILQIGENNNPDPESETEKDSKFSNHKREVIKEVVTSNLNQAITSYSRNSEEGDFYLPELTETDWDQILTNVSIITFVQDIPIGLKEYNHYAIATSTVNKEYVDPDEIYLYNEGLPDEDEYHMPYCDKLSEESLIGYRSIDFMQKNYANGEEIKYYYKHSDDASQACYNCLVQRSLYQENSTDIKQTAYYTTLARERYVARMSKLPAEVEPSYFIYVMPIDVDNPTKVSGEYIKLETAKYTINNGEILTGATRNRIEKSNEEISYEIKPLTEGNKVSESGETISDSTGTLDSPKDTELKADSEIDIYSIYESDSYANITINEYSNEKVRFSFSDDSNVDWAIAETPSNFEYLNPGKNGEFNIEDDGYINVILKYKQNFKKAEEGSGLNVWANINNFNNLTIVTETTGISGYVRLKFTSGDNTFYSKEIFNLAEGNNTICCKIQNNKDWYNKTWHVDVLSLDKNVLAGGDVSYYTVRDAVGLRGFADAVNEGAKTEGREFYLYNDINMEGTVMQPIGTTDTTAFKGKFDSDPKGNNVYTISNMTINPQDTKYIAGKVEPEDPGKEVEYKYFGLFGKIDNGAEVSNVIINNANINLYTINGKSVDLDKNPEYRTGGIVGLNNGTLVNCNVTNSTINGTSYVGGIAGESTKLLSGLNVENTSVQTIGTCVYRVLSDNDSNRVNSINEIYVGGIVGKINTGENLAIDSCSITTTESKNIGVNESNFNWILIHKYKGKKLTYASYNFPLHQDNKNSIYIGGIAGHAEGIIESDADNKIKINGQFNIGTQAVECKIREKLEGGSEKPGGTLECLSDDLKIGYGCCVGGLVGYYKGPSIPSNIILDSNVNIYGAKLMFKLDTEGTVDGTLFADYNETKASKGDILVYKAINVTGGVVGYNSGSRIEGLENHIDILSIGENVGGIVGYNNGGALAGLKNYGSITTNNVDNTGDNRGGIVGYNKGNIMLCENFSYVEGRNNVGGIAGISNGSYTIAECSNSGSIWGSNSLAKDGTTFAELWGTGGIVGVNKGTTISMSHNKGEIDCNHTGGGITGVNDNALIEYCYNREEVKNRSDSQNRIGGITGYSKNTKINYCYNVGDVTGQNITNMLSGVVIDTSGAGGIVGTINGGSINYSYNAGNIKDIKFWGINNTNGGIVGRTYLSNATYINNYYLANTASFGKDGDTGNGYQVLSENDFTKQLYNWASKGVSEGGVTVPNGTTYAEKAPHVGKYIYNTTAPLEEDKGYRGYGVLWWEIKDYVKLTTNMFLCNKKNLDDGTVEYKYSNFKNTGYNQTITLINSENKEGEIAFSKTKFEMCRVEQSFNGKPVDNTSGCYRWIMMIPKGNYSIKGKTDFSDKSQFFNNNSMLYEGQKYDAGYISNDTTLYIAPILEVIADKFDIKNIGAEWKRENTKIKRYGVYTKPDFVPRTIEVNAHYYKKPNNSSYTIKNKTASVYLDKLETLSTTNNTTAYLDNYTYYTMGFGKMKGPYTKTGDTEKIRSDSAQCNVYINVENLVDKLGEETARNYILHSAEINMNYRIKMWCEKDDFGSWFTNPAKLKNSTLEYTVTVQRKAKNSQQWVSVSSINVPTQYKTQTSESGNIGDDGYYEFTYEIEGEDFSGSLAGLNYNDDIRIVVGLNFISKEGNCTFYIDDAELDITYGPNVEDV